MGIVSYGVVASSPPTSSEGLKSKTIPYAWNSPNFGYEIKQDSINFPLFSALTKIVSNFPIRLRLYQSLEQQSADIDRPPWISAQVQPLVEVLIGQGMENSINLNPIPLIVDVGQTPITIEKLLPDEIAINLLIYLVG